MGLAVFIASSRSDQIGTSMYAMIATAITVGITIALIFRHMKLPPETEDCAPHLDHVLRPDRGPGPLGPPDREFDHRVPGVLPPDEHLGVPEPVWGPDLLQE